MLSCEISNLSPTIWVFLKRGTNPLRCINNMADKKTPWLFTIGRFILKALLVHSVIVFYAAVGGIVVNDLFVVRAQETINLTYYGFAIFAALASISFTYSRTFDNGDSTQIFLRQVGERFFFSAIGFLIGSVLNYLTVHVFSTPLTGNYISVMKPIVQFVGGFFFLAAFFYSAITTHSLLDHLFEKVTLNKHNFRITDENEEK